MKVAYKSDAGKERENNEDRILVDEDRGIFLLADGMGGHKAGEIASRLAVEEAYACLKDRIDQVKDEKSTSKLLIEALFNAHDAIKEKAKADLNLMGMGTTLVEMILKAEKAYICHVGDSRVYLLREGAKQLTKDQTVGDYLVGHNIMRREEVPPQKWHTLTQAVGISENIVPELKCVEIKSGDLLLLCSDGLTDMLSDEEIEKIIQKHRDDMDAGVEALVKGANNKGGKDNISVILIKWE